MGTGRFIFLVIAFIVAGHTTIEASTTTTKATTTTNSSEAPLSTQGNTTIINSSAVCEDTVPDCESYKKEDLCEGDFQLYGAIQCRKTCGHCNDSCVDEISNCTEYNQTTDICKTNKTWSLTHCEKFCGFCGVLGNTCNKTVDVFCKRITGASCKKNVCTCDAGFRPLADIECEEVYWKKCNATHNCGALANSVCTVPNSPGITRAPWTNATHCLCKPDHVYIHENHSCDADCKDLPKISNGLAKLVTNRTTLGSEAIITCDSEFYTEIPHITCKQTGNNASWSNSSCKPGCRKPNNTNTFTVFTNSTSDETLYKQDDVLEYNCTTGYTFQNNATLRMMTVCKKSGAFQQLKVCSRKDCGDPGIPVNGTVDKQNGTKYQAVITYRCHSGFDMVGYGTAVCQVKGTWSNNRPTCKIKDCKEVPMIGNGTAKAETNRTTYGAKANVTCNPGFYTDIPQINCTQSKDNVTWSTSTCKQVHLKACSGENECSSLANSECKNNSRKECVCKVGFFYNITNYSCDKVLQASCTAIGNKSLCTRVNHAKCANDSCICGQGFEMKNQTSCEEVFNKTCDGMRNKTECSHLDHSVCKDNTDESNNKKGKNETCQCQIGYYYHFENDTHANCLKGCRRPDNTNTFTVFTNSTSNGTLYKHGDVLEYNCTTGYTFGNRSILQVMTACTKSGDFQQLEVCSRKDCNNPTKPGNGSFQTINGTIYQALITYSCNEGYNLTGATTAVCQANETWSAGPPDCIIKDCNNPTKPGNGSFKTINGTKYQALITYACNEGYNLTGATTAICQANETWSAGPPDCIIKDCTDPTPPGNGSFHKPNGTTYQAEITYYCYEGYNLTGAAISVCQADKAWSVGPPKCVIRDCGDPGTLVNGTVDKSNGTKYQANITYKCDIGFDTEGFITAVCQANETWSNNRPTCKIKDCKQPKNTNNGNVSLASNQTVYLHNATYVCNSGYETTDTTHVTCNASGHWSSPPPSCKDVDECKRYTAKCHKWANCTNTPGNYTCQCKTGFNDTSSGKGLQCEDINECASENNSCNPNGSLCVNYPGSYRCDCNDGWTGKYCETDIDECNSTTTCGGGAYCNNTEGGYSCTCGPSLPKGDPKVQCYENVIIQLETKIETFRGDNPLVDAKPFQHRFPYFGEGYTSYRPYMDGFIALAYQPIYESYGPDDATQWKDVTHGYTVIAPLWTNIDSTNLTGGLSVHYFDTYSNNYSNGTQHKDLQKIQKAFADYYNLTSFKLRLAIVATWENVTMSSYIPTVKLIKTQNASMQVILISDGVYSYVMFNYDQELWSLKIGEGIPSSSGYSLADKTGFITANSSNFSQLNNGTNVKPVLKGRWIYNVSSTDTSKNGILKNESECLEFGQNSSIKTWLESQRAKSDPCPCSEVQIQYDLSFHYVTPMYQSPEFKMVCYEEWFFNNDDVKQTCCYRSGALEKDNIGGGFATFQDDKYNTVDYFYKCCGADGHLCHTFYDMNPSDDCSRYNAADEPLYRNKRSLIGYLKTRSGKFRAKIKDLNLSVISGITSYDLIFS